jgi:Zn-dependent M28 family amino/carboxypeptidase
VLLPAADDNSSGVVNPLDLSRILIGRVISSTVVLLLSTGEEHGALGVQSFVDQLTPEEFVAIKYVVDVDTLGYGANNGGVMELFSGY